MIIETDKLKEKIKEEIRDLSVKFGQKNLGIFYVGQNEVIENFIKIKERFGKEIGISVEVLRYDENISEEYLINEIKEKSEKFSGVIVQLPLPEKFSREKVLNAIPLEKDVDLLSVTAFENFSAGKSERLPPVVSAINEIFKFYNIPFFPKKILIIGKGILVGKPLAIWLNLNKVPFEIVDKETPNILEMISTSDIIISGTGERGLVKKDMVKEGVILIDAGTSVSSGKVFGDIEKDAFEKALLVSPVPGGVGPLTVASLFKNLFLDNA